MAHNGTRDGRRRQTVRRVALAASVAGALAVIVPAAARAGTIAESFSYGPTLTTWSHTFDFQGFNALAPNNGAGLTLTGVTFNYTDTISGTLSLDNQSSSAAVGSASLVNNISRGTGPVIFSGTASTGSLTVAANTTVNEPNLSGGGAGTEIISTNLSQFLGAYTELVNDVGVQSSTFTGGNVKVTPTNNGKVALNVVYTYVPSTQVPEPSSLLLLGTGLMGLGMVMSRRRRMF